jgi:hypothetical protein
MIGRKLELCGSIQLVKARSQSIRACAVALHHDSYRRDEVSLQVGFTNAFGRLVAAHATSSFY